MPFHSLSKSLKKNFKKILNSVKYGDDHRLPLVYLVTNSTKLASLYELPEENFDEPFSTYQNFPKLSQEILLSLFSSIGVKYVPEVALFELRRKTPQKSFRNFCTTFGEVEEGVISSVMLNETIQRLQKMDRLRQQVAFDSRPIYKALSDNNFVEANRLIDKMKKEK